MSLDADTVLSEIQKAVNRVGYTQFRQQAHSQIESSKISRELKESRHEFLSEILQRVKLDDTMLRHEVQSYLDLHVGVGEYDEKALEKHFKEGLKIGYDNVISMSEYVCSQFEQQVKQI